VIPFLHDSFALGKEIAGQADFSLQNPAGLTCQEREEGKERENVHERAEVDWRRTRLSLAQGNSKQGILIPDIISYLIRKRRAERLLFFSWGYAKVF